jgi:hypothetical protein
LYGICQSCQVRKIEEEKTKKQVIAN